MEYNMYGEQMSDDYYTGYTIVDEDCPADRTPTPVNTGEAITS